MGSVGQFKIGGLQPAVEDAALETVLGKQERRGRALGSVAAGQDILPVRVQAIDLHAQHGQRNVDRAFHMLLVELVVGTNIDQQGTAAQFGGGILFRKAGNQGIGQICQEIVFFEAHQNAVFLHPDGGVTATIGDQRFLAETIPFLQGGQLHLAGLGRGTAIDAATAALDDIIVVILVPLLQDDLVFLGGQFLHAHEDRLDVFGRQFEERA